MKPITNLREQISYLEEKGLLKRITKPVNSKFELSAVSKKLESGPALLFENVIGYDIPVVIGTDNSRERIANVLGTDNNGLIDIYKEAIENPLPPVYVDDGPVKEVKITENINLLKILPIPFHHEKNAGHYITNGLFIAENPDENIRNVSFHRLQVKGPTELRASILPRHLLRLVKEYEGKNKPLPIAISIGNDISLRLAAATWGSKMPYGKDEFGVAGRLRGVPVPLVTCETSGVRVPAYSEIVIEGVIQPGAIGDEGGFAELTGNYAGVNKGYIINVTAITHRKDAIYQDLLVFTPEHHLLLGLPLEPTIYSTVKASVPGTKAVHVTPGGCGKFHVVVSIKKSFQGDGKEAIIAGLHGIRDIKLVTVVDDDVDLFNPREVEWAVATRFQADRDLVVISGAKGNELDHSCLEVGLTAKMGIDATYPISEKHQYQKIAVPGEDKINLSDYI